MPTQPNAITIDLILLHIARGTANASAQGPGALTELGQPGNIRRPMQFGLLR
jgi:hypothetical protein